MPETKDTTPISTIHLRSNGCSGRAVRYRVLTPAMIGHIESQVSHTIDSKATSYDFGRAVATMGIEQMIAEVSEPATRRQYEGKPELDAKGDPVKGADGQVIPPKPLTWTKLTSTQLHDNWDTYFNAKDTALLCRIYGLEHTVEKDELEDVLAGKVTTLPA